MAEYIVSSNSTTAIQPWDLEDSIYVLTGVSLTVTSGNAISTSGNLYLPSYFIDGHVTSTAQAIRMGFDATFESNPRVFIGSQGSVSSIRDDAIYLVTAGAWIKNQGEINAYGRAVYVHGNESFLENTGTISSTAAGVFLDGTSKVINSGLVSANSAALELHGSTVVDNSGTLLTSDPGAATVYVSQGIVDFTNTGRILSNSNALNFDTNTFATLINSGELGGNVYFGNLKDTFTMAGGDVTGDVFMNDGQNTFIMTAGLLHGSLSFGGGDDIVRLLGGRGLGNVSTGAGTDTIIIDGFRTTQTVQGGTGNDVYYVWTSGVDIKEQQSATDLGDTVRARIDYTLDEEIEILTLLGNDDLRGRGNESDNTITGNSGENRIEGRSGDDVLIGDDNGDDLRGGTGNDTASYVGSDAGVQVNLAKGSARGGHADGDRLASIENLTGSSFADSLIGSVGANTLDGGAGNDRLTGGKGADIFVFSAGSGIDTIADFEQGVDLIHISGFGGVADAFEDLVITRSGRNVRFDFDAVSPGDAIVIVGAKVSQIDATDFAFV